MKKKEGKKAPVKKIPTKSEGKLVKKAKRKAPWMKIHKDGSVSASLSGTIKITTGSMGAAYVEGARAFGPAEIKTKIERAKKEGKPWKVKKLEKELVQGEEYWRNRPVEEMTRDWNGQTYEESKGHPHRQLILESLRQLGSFAGLLEVGCNSGPNLALIQEQYPETQMAGVDINSEVIDQAKKLLPQAILKVGEATALPFDDKEFDVVLADACYMYVKDIDRALDEAIRIARKAIIIVDWASTADEDEIRDGHWSHDFVNLLGLRGWNNIVRHKLTEKDWPNKNWVKNGYIIVATR